MKKVIVQFADKIIFFDAVTRVQFYNKYDILGAQLYIYQEEKVTIIETCEIEGFEVKDML